MAPDAPICYNWYLYSRSGGLLAGPPPWNDDCQPLSPLTEKSPLFQTPQKAAPSDPGIAFSRICVDFGELFEVIWLLFFTKKIGKVCLDCAGVYGSHVRPSRKLHFFKMLPLIFWCFFPVGVFYALFGRRGRQSLKNGSKKRATFALCCGGAK